MKNVWQCSSAVAEPEPGEACQTALNRLMFRNHLYIYCFQERDVGIAAQLFFSKVIAAKLKSSFNIGTTLVDSDGNPLS